MVTKNGKCCVHMNEGLRGQSLEVEVETGNFGVSTEYSGLRTETEVRAQ
jgi:hypothetical protein